MGRLMNKYQSERHFLVIYTAAIADEVEIVSDGFLQEVFVKVGDQISITVQAKDTNAVSQVISCNVTALCFQNVLC